MQSEITDLAAYFDALTASRSERLRELLSHRDPFVRVRVASNPHTPPTCLGLLAHDDVPAVRAAVAGNPATPDVIREDVVRRASEAPTQTAAMILAAAAHNPVNSESMNRRLYALGGFGVCIGLSNHARCPKDVLDLLAELPAKLVLGLKDEHQEIRELARKRLEQLKSRP